jgi:protein-tyrosine-phosphatase
MAEIIFSNLCKKNKRSDIVAESAGTAAAVGTPISLESKIALRDCRERLPKTPHTARQFTPEMFSQYDHIICLTNGHKLAVCGYGTIKPPNEPPVTVRTLDEWVGCGDIADPWQCGADKYYEVCKKLQTALKLLFKEITK